MALDVPLVSSNTTVVEISESELKAFLQEVQQEENQTWYEEGLDYIVGGGKKAIAYGVGFMDAMTAFRTLLGLNAETTLPWQESKFDQDAKMAGYATGMAANLAFAGAGTYMTGEGLAVAATCGTVAGGGLALSETGVGAVVAVGGGSCALTGLAEAGVGAAAVTYGGANLANTQINSYARRAELDESDFMGKNEINSMGKNGRQNAQFGSAAQKVFKRLKIDPKSKFGKKWWRHVHDELHKAGECAPSFGACIELFEREVAGFGVVLNVTPSESPSD